MLCFLLIPALFLGCEDLGIVGNSVIGPQDQIRTDTFSVENITPEFFEGFTGGLPFVSAGRFSDSLFGDLTAVALLKPELPNQSLGLEMNQNATMKLRLHINQDHIYGDAASTQSFEPREVDELWRGKAWKVNDQVATIPNQLPLSFEVAGQDSIDIALPGNMVRKYREFFNSDEEKRDSLYFYTFHGLALHPVNEAKLVPFTIDSSKFIIENEEDTLNFNVRDWAYSLTRENVSSVAQEEEMTHNTLERVLGFDLDLDLEQFRRLNIAKAELIFYRNDELLENTRLQAGPQVVRPGINNNLRLHITDTGELPVSIDPGSPVSTGSYNEQTGLYRFVFTSGIRRILYGDQELERFYLTILNDGVVRSNVLYNNDAPPELSPKLIISYIQSGSE